MNLLILKKVIRIFLTIVVLAQIMPVGIVSANTVGNSIEFDGITGELVITVTSNKATTGIRFRSVGWMVSDESSCRYYENVYDCRPRENNSRVIFMDNRAVRTESNGLITTTWRYSREEVAQKFFDAFYEKLQSNQKLYFSSIMESYDASTGNPRVDPQYTLRGIKYAEA